MHEAITAFQAHRLVSAQYGSALELDGRCCRQHNLTTGAILPQTEIQVESACLAVVDGQVERRLTSLYVMGDVGKAVTYVLLVEGSHDITGVSVQLIIEIYLSTDAH